MRKGATVAGVITGIVLGAIAGWSFHGPVSAVASNPAPVHETPTGATPAPSSARTCPPLRLAIAFTTNVTDASALHLSLPWGTPGDPEGPMIEDYGAYDGTSVREQLPVHDVTTGTLEELSGHNAIDIVMASGTPLFAVTSGTVYQIRNWTIPGGPQGYAVVVVSDVLHDDRGVAIAFLYGHVSEFDVADGQHVASGALIARSGGEPGEVGAGFSDTPNVHFEIIESPLPLRAHAGTVNPHQFLQNLYAYDALRATSNCAA